jgi:acetyl-CoA C-acetyltransferase
MKENYHLTKYIDHLTPVRNSLNKSKKKININNNDIVIVSAVRTPVGSYGGSLSSFTASELGAIVIRFALEKISLSVDFVDEVYMGNVLQAGVGQNPARQALISSGLPSTCPATTVNKVCASGMKVVSIALGTIKLGYNESYEKNKFIK